MKKNYFLFLVLCLLSGTQLKSQTPQDTLGVNLQQVNVNARRNMVYSESGRIVTIMDKQEIKRSAAQSIDQLLDYVSGVDIRQRGINGSQSDISIRGGSFDQVLILLNGVNITDPQTGHYNLEVPLNIADISRIEVLQGSASRVLGPNAFSGAINIVTDNATTNKLNATISGGSFNSYNQSLSGNWVSNRLNTFVSLQHNSSEGYMNNTDYDFKNAYLQSSLRTDNAGKFNFQAGVLLKQYGANSFYSLSYPMQYERTKTFFTALNWNYSYKKLILSAQGAWRRHHDRFELYRDSISKKPSWYTNHNYHLTDVAGGKVNVGYTSLLGKTTLGIDIRNEHIFSNVLGTKIDTISDPMDNKGFFTKKCNRLVETVLIDQAYNFERWYISAGGALTNTSIYGIKPYGGLDLAYEIENGWRMFINVNTAIRIPTFTDLYYQSKTQMANPDLKPESSQTIELGTKYYKSSWKLDADLYYRRGQNIIDWVKLPEETIWKCMNQTEINALGSDISLVHYFDNSILRKLSTSYSFLTLDKSASNYDSKYALDYLKHKLIISCDYQLSKYLSAGWSGSYLVRSGTYTDANKNTNSYQPYFVMDGKLCWEAKYFDIFASLNNIFSSSYCDYGGLKQPGFSWNVGTRIKL